MGKHALLLLALLLFCSRPIQAATGATVVLWDPGFPAIDTAAPDQASLAALQDAKLVDAAHLPASLTHARLLVLPYGSAFPEDCWPAIYQYLQNGGNLLVVGGRPFSVAVAREHGAWVPRAARQAWARALYINDYTETPGSAGLQHVPSARFHIPVLSMADASMGGRAALHYDRAWSLTPKLSTVPLYNRIGSAGSLDTRFDTLYWGDRPYPHTDMTVDVHHVSAPIVQLDHVQHQFVGGRWVLVPAQLTRPLAPDVLQALASEASAGAVDVAVEPEPALVLPGDPLVLKLHCLRFSGQPTPLRVEVTEQDKKTRFDMTVDTATVRLPVPPGNGFHTIRVDFYDGGRLLDRCSTGYWIRDAAALRSGPVVTVDQHFFRFDGRPQPIVGTTYMASDVQRQFLVHPNPYVWDQDFQQMRAAGITMIRTGIWSGWDKVAGHEAALRNLEAWLMTAHKYGMAVQFNFFAFIPDNFGGQNPYLDPTAVAAEQRYVSSIVSRFKDCPWLMWDLINEPSFDKPGHLWATRANGDRFESRAWNAWLLQKHGSPEAIANAWNMTTLPHPIPVPEEQDFSAGSLGQGGHPLMVHDFYLFAQDEFVRWAGGMRDVIRKTGSHQLITVGQDEGGGFDRLNPSYWMDVTDFTTNHSWWQTDALLWDSLVAIQPGLPALIQETGLQNDLQIDQTWRRTIEERAALLERKGALALATTAGVIQWLWNVNATMVDDGEVTIGVIRADGTEKPEANVLRGLAAFANQNRDAFVDPEPPSVMIVFDHDLLYSPFFDMATVAQRKAVRVLHNLLHVPALAMAENRLQQMGHPKLVILPSPEVLNEDAWQALLAYVRQGGTLLITGSFERDPYWRVTHRLQALGLDAAVQPLNFRQATLEVDGQTLRPAFNEPFYLDRLECPDHRGWHELALGTGHLLVASYPIELSEGNDATAAVYTAALRQAGVEAPYDAPGLSPGVLVRPVVFKNAVLYLFMSESGSDEPIDLHDHLTGAHLRFTLPTQRASLILLNRQDGTVRARYWPARGS